MHIYLFSIYLYIIYIYILYISYGTIFRDLASSSIIYWTPTNWGRIEKLNQATKMIRRPGQESLALFFTSIMRHHKCQIDKKIRESMIYLSEGFYQGYMYNGLQRVQCQSIIQFHYSLAFVTMVLKLKFCAVELCRTNIQIYFQQGTGCIPIWTSSSAPSRQCNEIRTY